MIRIAFYLVAAVIILHGMVHLMGFVAYWPLGEIAGLPYKTTLFGERWSVGAVGMRFYSVLWLAAAVSLVVATGGLIGGQSWWYPLMWVGVSLSLVTIALDWSNAFRGAILSLVILVPLLLVLGLRIQPRPFSAYTDSAQELGSIALPHDLPAPVVRYYETIGMGEHVPLIESAVMSARGTLRFAGITFPARLRFTHDAGQGYRHYIEATLFGYPLMQVNETYLDGRARMALPMGVIENEPKVDMAANLGLWGESIWLPSIFLTDPRVRWEPVNDRSARLIVPFGSTEDAFTVYFDANTGLITHMEAMRFKQATDEAKTAWRLDILNWDTFNGILIPSSSTITWADEGTPWLAINIEDIAYNVDVADYIRSTGP